MKAATLHVLVVVSIVLAGCASNSKPRVCRPLPTLTPEEATQLQKVRESGLAKLKSYQVGVTTREGFLSDCWRSLSLVEQPGEIGMAGYRISRDDHGKIVQSIFHLGYHGGVIRSVSGSEYYNESLRTEVCTLTFDERGLLKSVDWNNKSANP